MSADPSPHWRGTKVIRHREVSRSVLARGARIQIVANKIKFGTSPSQVEPNPEIIPITTLNRERIRISTQWSTPK
jgi:hypothetical protein